ncbi:nucleotidyltransferase family protein [Allosphingosinicella deserti]|uniref:nucleotidyltransferase family protein n=1 Tax=Allosphingosinicella deserti TaxID=2116704 RepID=UPI0013048B35|nr:nucleotidyltransferase family protein [Sphingomonas deserti]
MLQPTLDPGTYAVVLAAGAARRFGGGKLTAMLNGRPLVSWSVEKALQTRVELVTVVLGADAEAVAGALPSDVRLRVIVCPDWEEGLSRSLRCGVQTLPDHARALLLFLGDMPDVSSALADRMLRLVLDGAPAAMPVCDGQPAHPVAISAKLFPALRSLRGDQGARNVLRAASGAVEIATDERGSITDVDTEADLRSLA